MARHVLPNGFRQYVLTNAYVKPFALLTKPRQSLTTRLMDFLDEFLPAQY